MDTLTIIAGMILQQVIPAAAIGTTIVVLLRTKAGRGILQRLTGSDLDTSDLTQLQDEVTRLHEELVDVQERLDFTERALLNSGTSSGGSRDVTPTETTPV